MNERPTILGLRQVLKFLFQRRAQPQSSSTAAKPKSRPKDENYLVVVYDADYELVGTFKTRHVDAALDFGHMWRARYPYHNLVVDVWDPKHPGGGSLAWSKFLAYANQT